MMSPRAGRPVPPRSPFSGDGPGSPPALAVWSFEGECQHFIRPGWDSEKSALNDTVEHGLTLCGRNASGWAVMEFDPELDICSVCNRQSLKDRRTG